MKRGPKKTEKPEEPKKQDKRTTKKTKLQVMEREKFSSLLREWNKLEYEKKLEWLKSAKESGVIRSGKGKEIVEGQQLFMSYNGYLLQIGETINLKPPIIKDPSFIFKLNFDIENNKSGKKMNFNFEPALDKDTKAIIYSTKALNIYGTNIDKKYFRSIAVLEPEFMSGGSILAQYLLLFKKLPKKGEVIGLKVLTVNRQCGKPSLPYAFPYIIR